MAPPSRRTDEGYQRKNRRNLGSLTLAFFGLSAILLTSLGHGPENVREASLSNRRSEVQKIGATRKSVRLDRTAHKVAKKIMFLIFLVELSFHSNYKLKQDDAARQESRAEHHRTTLEEAYEEPPRHETTLSQESDEP